MQQYDWWQAGTQAGTAPSEWETIQYGRDTALGWLGSGRLSMEQAIGQGFDAMYRLAYHDIRDTITRTNQLRRTGNATSETDVHNLSFTNADVLGADENNVFDVLDWIARAPLTTQQQRIVTLYSLGWTLTEAAQDLGLSYSSVRRWFRSALPVLRGEI